MSDCRERDKWYHSFDSRSMTITIEEAGVDGEDLVVPVRYEVCDVCEGKGMHVNPSIDSHGISPEEFAEDPDFAESYFRGDYDQPCNECGGQRVVPVIDESRTTPEQIKAVNDHIDDLAQYRAEVEAERRMGA